MPFPALAALIWSAAFALYLHTLCPALGSGDTGELFLAGWHLDVTHPPGYPLEACLLRLATLLPAGGLMFRAGLVSVAAGACAVTGLFTGARALGVRRGPALLAAALFATAPFVWWQATLLEKYAFQLGLAALVLSTVARTSGSPFLPGLAWAMALTHHSLALFLLPVAAAGVWERGGRAALTPRTVGLLLGLLSLPFSLRLVYPAIRADALHRTVAGQARAINWGEPYQARAWWDYHRLAYYANRFKPGVALDRAGWRAHVGFYPAQLGWPGVLLGLAGLVLLARSRPVLAGGLGVATMASGWFAIRFPLPPSLAPNNHQNGFLILALAAGLAGGALLRGLLADSRWRQTIVGALLVILTAGAWQRYHRLDAGRHLAVFDLNAATLAVAPPHAVLLAMFDTDMFALRWFQDTLGRRPDLVPLQMPHRIGPGQFIVRRRYGPWAAAVLPGATLRFTEDDSGFVILRRII